MTDTAGPAVRFGPDDILVRQAALTAFSVWLAAFAAFALALPDPWWAGISAWVVASPDHRAVVTKSAMRLVGTFAGCFLGFWIAVATAGEPFEQTVVLAALLGFGSARRFVSRYAYAWVIFIITVMMVVVENISADANLFELAVARAMEISVGVIAHLVAALAFGRLVPKPEPAPAPAANPAVEQLEVEHVALVVATTTVVMLVLWSMFDLPSIAQMLVSAIAVTDRQVGRMGARGSQRILGCLIGGGAGIGAALLLPQSLFLWSVVFAAGMWWFARLHHGNPKTAYIGTQGGIGFILGMITGPGAPTTILPAVERLAGMLLGVSVLIAVVVMLRPLLLPRIRPHLEPAAG